MKYQIHLTYEKHDDDGRLWLIQPLYANSQKEAEIKAERLMSEFKDAKLVSLIQAKYL